MSPYSDMEMSRFSLVDIDRAGSSKADPDVLARAVRAHKVGDAMAQAALTIALMVAIGAVAFVLSSGHAAAAGLIVSGVMDNSAALLVVGLCGVALLVARRVTLRAARIHAARRRSR